MCRGEAGVDRFGVFEDDGIESVGGGGEEAGVAKISFLFLFWRIVFIRNDTSGPPGAGVAFEAGLLIGKRGAVSVTSSALRFSFWGLFSFNFSVSSFVPISVLGSLSFSVTISGPFSASISSSSVYIAS